MSILHEGYAYMLCLGVCDSACIISNACISSMTGRTTQSIMQYQNKKLNKKKKKQEKF